MKERLQKLWQSRSPRDRVAFAILAVVVGLALYLWLLQSAYRARTQLGGSVSTLRAQAVSLDADAAELERLRSLPPPAAPQTDLRTQMQAQAGATGLARSIVRMDAPDANQVQVVFGSVAFADWLGWVTSLQAQQIRLDSSRIEALSTPGLVGVTATFTRARSQ